MELSLQNILLKEKYLQFENIYKIPDVFACFRFRYFLLNKNFTLQIIYGL